MGRPRGRSGAATVAKILPAARKLFAKQGYDKTTFSQVGKAVGVSHAAIHCYYPTKPDLYIATLADTQRILLPDSSFEIDTSLELREALGLILRTIADQHKKDPDITGFLAATPVEMMRHSELNNAVKDSPNDLYKLLLSLFEGAIANGEVRAKADSDMLFNALLGGSVGVALFSYGLGNADMASALELYIDAINGELFN